MHRLLLVALSLLLFALGGLAAEEVAGGDADAPLMDEMSAINRAFKIIRRNASKTDQRPEVIAAVELMTAHATAAKNHLPPIIATLPVAERSAAKQDYGERMTKVIADLSALKAALEANDEAKITTLIKALSSAKKEGHERYIPEEDE